MEKYPADKLHDDGTLDKNQFLPNRGCSFKDKEEGGKRVYWVFADLGKTIHQSYFVTDSKGKNPLLVTTMTIPAGIDGNGRRHPERKYVIVKWEVT